MVRIVAATSQAQLEEFRVLVREFVSWAMATFDPGASPPSVVANLKDELEKLPRKYNLPDGFIFLAYQGEKFAGCIAGFRNIHGLAVTRLWVRADSRGHRVDERLIETLLANASKSGYREAVEKWPRRTKFIETWVSRLWTVANISRILMKPELQ
ncbi:MAG: GNAT superfamily N-acetyltransferase [Yoonia sp.]|jgi:GNAT superfamily N-acetyltransferase